MLYEADGGNQRDSFNLLGLDANVIATTRGTGSSEAWYLYNKETRGSTSSLIDDGGTVAVAYEYDAFGNTTIRTGEAFDNEICYTGQVYDKETGLYYYNARFYDPEDGRFLTQDTYRGENMEPDTLHLYVYCANNPVNYVDPSGHKSIMSIYYNKKETGFSKQAKQSCYYLASNAKMKAVISISGFKKAWKSISKNIKTLYLYLHGGEGALYFYGETMYYGSIKKLNKKKKLKKIVLLSCKGGRGRGSSSVAKALYLATDKKAKVYASRESISYRTETRGRRIVYRPRYSSDYIKEYNRKHKKKISVFTNPIKRICG